MHVLRMLRTGGIFGVCYAPMSDAGSGGDTQMTSDAGVDTSDAGDPSGDDLDTGAHAGGEGDADDDESLLLGDDDDAQHDRRPLEEQLAALRKANRRLKSKHLKAKPVLDRLKGQNLDDIVSQARSFSELQRAAQHNPRLRALIYGGDADDPEPTRSQAKPAAASLPSLPSEFTTQTLGFDPDESPGNRVIANAIQHTAELTRRIAQLEALVPTVQNLDRTVTSSRQAAEKTSWSTQLQTFESELKKVAPGNTLLLTLARDAMHGAFQTRAQHGRSPDQIVQHYLKQFVKTGALTTQQAGKVNAATQSRMAAHNRTLPRSPAGGGQPSGARGNQPRLLKDVNRDLRAGVIGPR